MHERQLGSSAVVSAAGRRLRCSLLTFWELSFCIFIQYAPNGAERAACVTDEVSLKFQVREIHTCDVQSLMTNEDAEAAFGRRKSAHTPC